MGLPCGSSGQELEARGPYTTTTTTMITVRGTKNKRQQDKEATTTGVMVTVTTTCHCVCDNDLHDPEEDERQTTTEEMTGQREGTTVTTMPKMTVMASIMQDRLQERIRKKRPTISSDGIIRLLTDLTR